MFWQRIDSAAAFPGKLFCNRKCGAQPAQKEMRLVFVVKKGHFAGDAAKILPGVFLALIIAAAAKFIEGLLPSGYISASVIALFIGMILNAISKPSEKYRAGIKFTSKKLLKFAIILLGMTLDIKVVAAVGKDTLFVMLFTLMVCFGLGYFIGRLLKLNWKTSNLISAGTGICGGSAIASIAPVIDAEESDIAFAMSATFIFDMLMIIAFPLVGHALGMTNEAYGIWAGTAVNDTSSVVAAGYAFNEAAGDIATMVKLTRTLAIIPTVIVFSFIGVAAKRKSAKQTQSAAKEKVKIDIVKLIPWFIVAFVIVAAINSTIGFPAVVGSASKQVSKFLMVAALAAIGINTDLQDMKKAGPAPMIHGFIISVLVIFAALFAEYLMTFFVEGFKLFM